MIKEIIKKEILKLISEQKKWDENSIEKEALKYSTKTEFARKSPGAYNRAKELGIFDKVTSHMISKQIKWTEDMIRKEAMKYQNKSDFVKNSPKAADRARYYGIWDDVTQHMRLLGDLFKRMVYVYEFPDKTAYIGLTHDKNERDKSHKLSGRIAEYIKQTKLEPILKIVSDDYINAEDAQNLENCTIELYRKKGWKILNKTKGGSLGMCRVMWTKERVQAEVSKYQNFSDFRKNSKSAYSAVLRNNWLDDMTQHLKRDVISWTKDAILQLAINYDNLTDFIKEEPKAYQAAKRNGWVDEITKNMNKRNSWTKDEIDNEMSKFKSLKDFRNYSNSAYVTAVSKLGSDYINQFFGSTPKTKWTPELLKKEASKYKTRIEFLRGNLSAYKAAERQGVLDDILKNLEPDFKWDIEKVTQEAQKYKTRMDFKKGSSTAYKYAVKWKIIDDLIPSLK
jgi:predicted GIY-YIG superfamily endonuclease